MENEKERLLIIDSNSIIHRAYHALPRLTTKKGELVNAVYGFLLVFLKAIKDFQPDYIVACFDFPAPTFRHEKYKEYKAKRPKVPEELYQQIPKVKEVLEAFDVPIFEKERFEADDIIGTISRLAPEKQVLPQGEENKFSSSPTELLRSKSEGKEENEVLFASVGAREIETIILSGDSDVLQLVNSQTKAYTLRKGVKDIVLYDENLVKEKFQGLTPKQILDFKALRGDASDNIPGVTGIGEKTALSLLLKFESLENIYKELEENSEKAKNLKPKLKEILLKYKEQAFLSKFLARIDKNIPLDFSLEKCRWSKYSKEKATKILKDLEFNSLIVRLPEILTHQSKSENLKLF
ncbi:MAG: 5'-3' exonuclease H3TH domain-containing protein [bacterium]|nr:5'-3' exonuclease H3TH domain-containing protein [bacterium]